MKYLIANWKMNSLDISDWISKFENNCGEISPKEAMQIIVCPNFLQIPFFIEKSAFNAQTPCMDMICDYCIKKEIEIESISKFLTANLKAKIKEEALDMNLLKEKRKTEKLL